jgi:hypothetical protein
MVNLMQYQRPQTTPGSKIIQIILNFYWVYLNIKITEKIINNGLILVFKPTKSPEYDNQLFYTFKF